MPRSLRNDIEGVIFHVFNRGRRKSPIFLADKHRRFFLSRLVYAVRRGEIEVLAFVLMGNHFHLLVRSLGALSEAMRRIENEYSRYFNRKHGDEGELCRGRFVSMPVEDPDHLFNTVMYIDENALMTKPALATDPQAYAWGSAYRFARPRRTLWLSPAAIRSTGVRYGAAPSEPASYDARLARRWFIHARIRHGETGDEALPELLSGNPARVLAWLRRQAAARKGGGGSLPSAGPKQVLRVIRGLETEFGSTSVRLSRRHAQPALRLLTVGLLRDLSRSNFVEIAEATDGSDTTAKRRYRMHAEALDQDRAYAEVACGAVALCVAPLRRGR